MATVLAVLGVVSIAYGLLMAVLYPAGGFFLVWVALGAALVAAWRFPRIRMGVCSVCLVGLLAVGVLSALIWTAAAKMPPAGLDDLVVLGAGLRPDGTPSEALRYRLDAALAYLEENPGTGCVVSGGQGFGEVRTEADAMAEYLVERGLDEGRITREERSSTTAENVLFFLRAHRPGVRGGHRHQRLSPLPGASHRREERAVRRPWAGGAIKPALPAPGHAARVCCGGEGRPLRQHMSQRGTVPF